MTALNTSNWHFLKNGFSTGATNMEKDRSLAMDLLGGGHISTLRVYGWDPPSISVGWNQSVDEIRRDLATAAGIDIVRRPTGGRAILHENELTYSVTIPAGNENISAVYRSISLALVEALGTLGVKAMLERSTPHFPSLYRERSSAACFVSSARNEITVGGKKLVGSAQRRYASSNGREVVLQHGSILLGPEHRRIVDFLAMNADERESLTRQLRERTTDLREILGREVVFDEVSDALMQGFESAWDIQFQRESSEVFSE